MVRGSGGVQEWFRAWTNQKGIQPGDRVHFEVSALTDYFHYSCVVDQLNVGALLGAEVIARRLQQYIEAYDRVSAGSPEKPDWGLAAYFGERSPTDIVSPKLRVKAQQRVKDEVLLAQMRRGAGRGSLIEQAVDDGVLPAPANTPAPGKTRKGGGRGGKGAQSQ